MTCIIKTNLNKIVSKMKLGNKLNLGNFDINLHKFEILDLCKFMSKLSKFILKAFVLLLWRIKHLQS